MATPFTGFDATKLGKGAGCISADFTDTGTPATPAWTALFATRGGINVTVTQKQRYIEVDGVKENTAELLTNDGTTAVLTCTIVTADVATLTKLLPGSAVATDELTLTDAIDPTATTGDFSTLYFIESLGATKIKVHTLSNAISTKGLSQKTNKNGETEISVEFAAHYTLADQETVPYSCKEYTLA